MESFLLNASSSCLYPCALKLCSLYVLWYCTINPLMLVESCAILDDIKFHGNEFHLVWCISEPLKFPHLLRCP